MLIPQAANPSSSNNCCSAAIQAEAQRYYQQSLADPAVVGIFPFIWQTVSGTGYQGLRDSPSSAMKPTFQAIGNAIKTSWAFPAGTTPIFRSFSGYNQDHFFSASGTEGTSAYYIFESIGFALFTSSASGYGIYRCFLPGHHFVSNQSNCEGQTVEGLLGYAAGSQVNGTVPLYRFFNYNTGDHLVTTNYSEGPNMGFTYEATLGFVPVVNIP